ncbi:MAG: glyoxalase [Vicingaceae bacterium]|nr:glyoxalase [Vicingaceae bacterium]
MPSKLSIRPIIESIVLNENDSPQELFQNKTLRPIIKLQHDLLVSYFKEYLKSKNILFKSLTEQRKIEFIDSAFQKDNAFKSEVKGLIIGHLTEDEFQDYSSYKGDFNKRILAMVKQRVVSVIELF